MDPDPGFQNDTVQDPKHWYVDMRKEIETYQIAVYSCIIVGKNCLYLQQELSRRDKLQSTLMDNVSPDSVKRVENILEQVSIFILLHIY